jgi:hypothetical protein
MTSEPGAVSKKTRRATVDAAIQRLSVMAIAAEVNKQIVF